MSRLLTPDPLADLRNLLASEVGSGFFFKKDLADSPSSLPSSSLSEDEPGTPKGKMTHVFRSMQLSLTATITAMRW